MKQNSTSFATRPASRSEDSILNEQVWKDRQEELEKLLVQRRELTKRIQTLQSLLRQHGFNKGYAVNKQSLSFLMFGKKTGELTKEERREYNKVCQRNRRKKNKERIALREGSEV